MTVRNSRLHATTALHLLRLRGARVAHRCSRCHVRQRAEHAKTPSQSAEDAHAPLRSSLRLAAAPLHAREVRLDRRMNWQDWKPRPAFTTKSRGCVYPMYALGADGERYEGGTIYVHDTEVRPEDVEIPAGAQHRIGFLTWNRNAIQYVEVNSDWQRQGVGREMLRLARVAAPSLRHAPCGLRNEVGEAFVRATDPDEACPNRVEEVSRPAARPSGLWHRFRRYLGPQRI